MDAAATLYAWPQQMSSDGDGEDRQGGDASSPVWASDRRRGSPSARTSPSPGEFATYASTSTSGGGRIDARAHAQRQRTGMAVGEADRGGGECAGEILKP